MNYLCFEVLTIRKSIFKKCVNEFLKNFYFKRYECMSAMIQEFILMT